MKGNRQLVRQNREVALALERDGLVLQINQRIRQTSLHRQPGIEFNLTEQGSARFELAGETRELLPYQVIVFSGTAPHQMRQTSEDYRRTVLCVPGELKDHQLPPSFFMKLSHSQHAEVRRMLVRVQNEFASHDAASAAMRQALSLQLLITVFRWSLEQSIASKGNPLVQRGREWIRQNLQTEMRLQRAARALGTSPEHLTRSFRQETGMPFARFALSERVREAKHQLLARPRATILEIALELGFSDQASFCRAFRRFAGCSPSGYRSTPAEI